MHLGNSRWTYPWLSAGVCVAALLAPLVAGKTALSPPFVLGAALLAWAFGYFFGSREDGLRALSCVDALTGLFNRRFFEQSIEREVARAVRQKEPLALLVIDVDGMRHINDTLGHAAGDRALCAVSEALRHSLRATDLAARWGGDEFVVVAPCTGETAARALAERIVSTVHLRSAARRPVAVGNIQSQSATVTVSIGFSSVSSALPGQLRGEAMFAAADRALYEAKAKGPSSVQTAASEARNVIRAFPGRTPAAPIVLSRRRSGT